MATQKPISTISYNTESFLREKLEDWLNGHIIQSYQYICHKGEDGGKDHIHLRIEPNKRIDPMDLQEELREFVKDNIKPLGCRPWRPSKEEDWFLYVLHDEMYLKMRYGGGDKGEKIPYQIEDLRAPFDYDLEEAVTRAKSAMKHTAPAIVTQIQNGKSLGEMIADGENVYLLNAIISAMSRTDYKQLLEDNRKLAQEIEKLEEAIDKAGFELDYGDNGEYVFLRKSCHKVMP